MKIFQIELTNYCNFACGYCPRNYMSRPVGFMSTDTLKVILEKIENKILRLHHYGESLFDINIKEKIELIKSIKPDIFLLLNTNGSLLTNDKVEMLFNAGLDKIILSYHNEDSIKYLNDIKPKYRNKIEIIKISNKDECLDMFKKIGYKTKVKRLRDLGQLKHDKIINGNPTDRCAFLQNNEVAILWNGLIVPCCECYDDDIILGNIYDDIVVENKIFNKCHSCLGYGNEYNETEMK